MKRQASVGFAAFLTIAAALGISVRKPAERSDTEQAHAPKAVNPPTAKREQKDSACTDLREHLEGFLDLQTESLKTPCDLSSTPLFQGQDGLRFVIATLPDPLHTHLAVSFDEATASIQDAAQDENYDFDSSWLPWKQQDQPQYALLQDQERAEQDTKEREQQPGILLFRSTGDPGKNTLAKYRQGLIVFVVGEDATNGIHRDQFRNALRWICILAARGLGRSDRVLILGPTFSGSFPSLADLLAPSDAAEQDVVQQLGLKAGDRGLPLPIYSGTITGSTSAQSFQNQMDQLYGQKPRHILFRSFLQTDNQIIQQFLNFLSQRSGLDYSKVAILSEGETAYGRRIESLINTPILQAFYPRDISALRGAYQTQSLFDTGFSEQPQNAPRTSLPTDLADPTGMVHDSIPSYAANQTPRMQEAFLLQIVTALREHDIQYVLLRGSNPLDQLFLTNFLHRLYPHARIVIVGSDVLFIRERGATGLSGVMTLSTYPPSPLARHWTEHPKLPAGDRVFSSESSEGLYNAFRLLLNTDPTDQQSARKCYVNEQPSADGNSPALPTVSCTANSTKPPIVDYAPPRWLQPSSCTNTEYSYPGPYVWVSVIGVNRYWPLASLGPRQSTREACAADDVTQASVGDVQVPLVMKLALLGLLAFSVFHFYCCSHGSYMAKPGFRAHFAGNGYPRQTTLICLGSSVVAFAAIGAGWSCGIFSRDSLAMPDPLFALCCTAAVTLLAWGAAWSYGHRALRLRLEHSAEGVVQKNPPAHTPKEGQLPRRTRDRTRWFKNYRQISAYLLRTRFRGRLAFWLPVGMIVLFFCGFVVPLEYALSPENRLLTYLRSMSLASGLSPIVPFFALLIGLYIAFWYALHGLALFGRDRPRLPELQDLEFQISEQNSTNHGGNVSAQVKTVTQHKYRLRMFSQDAANEVEFAAKPLTLARSKFVKSKHALDLHWPLTACLLVLFWIVFAGLAHGVPVRTLGHRSAAIVFLTFLLVNASLLLAMCWRMCRTWAELRQLLEFLDRIPLRRTMDAIHGFSWESVWKMSGNVLAVRYKLISRQLDAMHHTMSRLKQLGRSGAGSISSDSASASLHSLEHLHDVGLDFSAWYLKHYTKEDIGDLRAFEKFQKVLAATCGALLTKLLLPAWETEEKSLILVEGEKSESGEDAKRTPPLSKEAAIRNAEELVCLMYLGFIQNILGRLRTMAISIVALFVSCSVAISTYPLDPRQPVSGALIVLFFVSSATIVWIYASMHRDATLSRVTNSTPGELGSEFWIKLLVFVVPTVLGLMARVFPGITDFFFTWLQPGLASLK